MTLPHISEETEARRLSCKRARRATQCEKTVCVSGERRQRAIHLELSWGLKFHLEATAHKVGGKKRQRLEGYGQVALGGEFWLAEDKSPRVSERSQSMCIQP